MRRVGVILVALTMVFAIAACGKESAEENEG